MTSTRVYTWPEQGDVEYLFNLCQKGQTADCYQKKRRNSRHSNDENGMICDFSLIFQRSVPIFL